MTVIFSTGIRARAWAIPTGREIAFTEDSLRRYRAGLAERGAVEGDAPHLMGELPLLGAGSEGVLDLNIPDGVDPDSTPLPLHEGGFLIVWLNYRDVLKNPFEAELPENRFVLKV